jgi:hypothetical protein
VKQIGEHERAVVAATDALAGARAREESARRALSSEANAEKLQSIDLAAVGDLAEFAAEAEKVRDEANAARAELDLAGQSAGLADDGDVREGLACLYRWLREGTADRAREQRPGWLVWVAAGLAIIASVLLAVYVSALWLVIAVLAAGTGMFAGRAPRQSDARDQYERDYGKLGLAAPESWTPDAVQSLVARLQKQDGDRVIGLARAEWRRRVDERLARIAVREREVEERRVSLAARLGVAPDTGLQRMSWLVGRLANWSDAHAEVERSAAVLGAARTRADAALARLGELFTGREEWGIPLDLAEASACLGVIERRVADHASAVNRMANARDRMYSADRSVAAADAQVKALLDRIGMTSENRDALLDLCGRHDAYRATSEHERMASQRESESQRDLESTAGYEPALAARPVSDMEAELAEVCERANGHEKLIRDVAALQTRIDEAKHASEIEDALLAESAAIAALEMARQRDIEAMVGNVIARHAERATRDLHTPAVLVRARELFLRVTRGRYRLDIDSNGERAFRAFDTTTNVGQALDKLSSATRVQLLLSVRIAFLETVEASVGCAMLPLLLDETLGTSDDQRAQAIIDTALDLAACGRQIFYFTAQSDEIEKWRTVMADRAIDYVVTDVAKARRMLTIPDADRFSFTGLDLGAVPDPGSMTHDEYGSLLGVAPIRRGRQDVGATHVWYMVDDPGTIARLMRDGISTWGQLSALGDGTMQLSPDLKSAYQKASVYARVIDELQRCASIGQGRRVDRGTLLASGAITPVFMERVAELAESLNGDAAELLVQLTHKRVAGFRESATEALRTVLSENGYIPAESPLSAEEIQRSALVVAFGDIETGSVTHQEIERLLKRVEAGPGMDSGLREFNGAAA